MAAQSKLMRSPLAFLSTPAPGKKPAAFIVPLLVALFYLRKRLIRLETEKRQKGTFYLALLTSVP